MLCAKPFKDGVLEYGCGQCRPCRLNRRRVWTSRLMLEAQLHEASSFLTLTYDEEHNSGSLDAHHLQDFLKRVRSRCEPVRLRFYAVGEYGEQTGRPHYHVALFGFNPVLHDRSIKAGGCECAVCSSWEHGHCDVGSLTEQSAAYIAGYVMNKLSNPARLSAGRSPEFARMSLRPGIGAGAVRALRNAMVDQDGVIHGFTTDVPNVIRSAGKRLPLGRYLRGKLREALGGDKREPELANQARQLEVIARDFPQFDRIKHFKELKESRRVQSQRRAHSLAQIARSRKGIGI